ncbi:MAG: cytochrome P450 [Candidatus Binatia bacterium]
MPDLGPASTTDLVAALPLPDTITNPYPVYEKLRPHTPVYGYRDYPPGTVPGQDQPVTAWVVMKYDEVAAAARDHDAFSSRDPLQEKSSAPTLMLVNHDNPEHDRLRRLVNVVFSRREVSALKPWVTSCVSHLFDDVDSREIEAVSALTSVLPARVMMHVLGRPDDDASRCRHWATAFMLSADLSPQQRELSNRSMVEYFADCVTTLHEEIEAGRPRGTGLIAGLLTAESDGERLTLEEVVRFCVTLVVAGAETTTFLLTNLLHNLATMPAIACKLRGSPSLVPAFIEETLRHSGPPQRLFRIATRDTQLGSATIREGDWVALFFAAANHDPAVFPDPDRFDLTRGNLTRHLTMGVGIHNCLGFALAKLEAAAMIEVVLERYSSIRPGNTPAVAQRTSLLTHSFDALPLVFET